MKTRNVMKIAGILLTLIMIVSLLGVFALTASAATGVVSYVDADGMEKTQASVEQWAPTSTSSITLTSGWHAFTQTSTVSQLIIEGDVHLILVDDVTLTCSSGVRVYGGNSITIYGQKNQTGTLLANTDKLNIGAGIGAGYEMEAGTITINGGNITAYGGEQAGGIGGGYRATGNGSGDITINGGTVNAYSGNSSSPGIGPGAVEESTCNITINGGTVNASGGASAAGIGAGANGGCGNITINGGTVSATGHTGIGGGTNTSQNVGKITINDGTVTAKGTEDGAGIGGGYLGAVKEIEINGGYIVATAADGAGIGGGAAGSGGTVTINGGTIIATGGDRGVGIGGGASNTLGGDDPSTVIITGGSIFASGPSGAIGNGATVQDADDNFLSLVTYTVNGVTDGTVITELVGIDYEEKDIVVNEGKINLYLPAGSVITKIYVGDSGEVCLPESEGSTTFVLHDVHSANPSYTAHATDVNMHVATYPCCDTVEDELHSFDSTGLCLCGKQATVSLTTADETPVVTYYASLKAAITAAQSASGSTIKLLDNCSPTTGSWFTISYGNFTIDLNGKQITVANSAYSAIVVESGNIILKDSVGQGGSNGGAFVRNGGTLTVTGGTYGGTVSTSNGTLIVEGGTFAVVSLDYDPNPGTLAVKGGDIAILQVRAQANGKKLPDALPNDYYLVDANGALIDPADAKLSDAYFYYVENVTVQHGAVITEDMIVVHPATYNGSQQEPVVTVTVVGTELVQGVDFTVLYPTGYDVTNAGTTAITVKGIGSYTGENTATYTIKKATLTKSDIILNGLDTTYNLKPQPVTVKTLPAGLDAQYVTIVGYMKNNSPFEGTPTDAGTYKVFVSVKNSPNYEDVSLEYDMVISPASVIVEIMDPTAEFIYNAYSHTPKVVVTLNGGLPFDPTEYGGIVKYTDNFNAGNATATVEGNFTGSCTFEIKKATPNVSLGAPFDKVMPGYVMNLNPTTDAIDKLITPITLTVLDGDGYSVNGNQITIDNGVVIGSTITVKVEHPETANYKATITEHTFEIGVPTVDTSEIEADIETLENAIADLEATYGTDMTELKADIAELKSKIADLNNGYATDAELGQAIIDAKEEIKAVTDTLATRAALEDAKNALQAQLDALDSTYATDADVKGKVDSIQAQINALDSTYATDTDVQSKVAAIQTQIDQMNTELATKAELETAKNDLQAQLDALDSTYATDADVKGKVDSIQAQINALDSTYATDADVQSKVAAIQAQIDALKTDLENTKSGLDKAKAELNKAIENLDKAMKKGDADLSAEISKLNTALTNAKAALKKADADNKAELVKKIEDADKALDDAIKAVQKNLDDAKVALDKAIADGDTALDGKISALNDALTSAKAALEAADASNKTELTAKINEANAALQATIDALSNELNNVKNELDNAKHELESKDSELQTFITIVCVISGVAFCGCGTLAVFYFIDKKKKI